MGKQEDGLTREQRYRIGKRNVVFVVSEALFEQFNKQLKKDGLTKKEVLETAIYQYLNGDMKINKPQ